MMALPLHGRWRHARHAFRGREDEICAARAPAVYPPCSSQPVSRADVTFRVPRHVTSPHSFAFRNGGT